MSKTNGFAPHKEVIKQLKESMPHEVRTYHRLKQRIARDKANLKFVAKRINDGNRLLEASGEQIFSLDNAPDNLDDLDDEDEAEKPEVKKGLLKRAWDRVPNLAEGRIERLRELEEQMGIVGREGE